MPASKVQLLRVASRLAEIVAPEYHENIILTDHNGWKMSLAGEKDSSVDSWISVTEAAIEAGVTENAIRACIRRNTLEARKHPNYKSIWQVSLHSVQKYVERGHKNRGSKRGSDEA